jgi:3,4-dihydroxy-2-butanone 4-phosphate synthase
MRNRRDRETRDGEGQWQWQSEYRHQTWTRPGVLNSLKASSCGIETRVGATGVGVAVCRVPLLKL